jgi:hypothetical protein
VVANKQEPWAFVCSRRHVRHGVRVQIEAHREDYTVEPAGMPTRF